MAEFRYGREELLTLYSKDQQPPDDLMCLQPLFVESALHPLAFSSNTEEEQVGLIFYFSCIFGSYIYSFKK